MKCISDHIIIFFLLLGLSFFSEKSVAQLTFEEVQKMPLGSTFTKIKQDLISKFSYEPMIMKGDFLNTYKIQYTDVPFDYYGNADYTFSFVENKLASIEIEFEFLPDDIRKVRRVTELMVNDIEKKFRGKKANYLPSDIDIDKAEKKLLEECKYNMSDSSHAISCGSNYYEFNKIKDTLMVDFLLGTSLTTSGYGQTRNTSCKANVVLYFSNYKTIGLLAKEQKAGIAYKQMKGATEIQLTFINNVYEIPVTINNTVTLNFILDLGASDVSLSPDVFLVLVKSGSITESDYIGNQTYKFADGNVAKSKVFNLKKIKIGNIEIENVRASISNSIEAPLLLGQSALKKLGEYKIDNNRSILIIK